MKRHVRVALGASLGATVFVVLVVFAVVIWRRRRRRVLAAPDYKEATEIDASDPESAVKHRRVSEIGKEPGILAGLFGDRHAIATVPFPSISEMDAPLAELYSPWRESTDPHTADYFSVDERIGRRGASARGGAWEDMGSGSGILPDGFHGSTSVPLQAEHFMVEWEKPLPSSVEAPRSSMSLQEAVFEGSSPNDLEALRVPQSDGLNLQYESNGGLLLQGRVGAHEALWDELDDSLKHIPSPLPQENTLDQRNTYGCLEAMDSETTSPQEHVTSSTVPFPENEEDSITWKCAFESPTSCTRSFERLRDLQHYEFKVHGIGMPSVSCPVVGCWYGPAVSRDNLADHLRCAHYFGNPESRLGLYEPQPRDAEDSAGTTWPRKLPGFVDLFCPPSCRPCPTNSRSVDPHPWRPSPNASESTLITNHYALSPILRVRFRDANKTTAGSVLRRPTVIDPRAVEFAPNPVIFAHLRDIFTDDYEPQPRSKSPIITALDLSDMVSETIPGTSDIGIASGQAQFPHNELEVLPELSMSDVDLVNSKDARCISFNEHTSSPKAAPSAGSFEMTFQSAPMSCITSPPMELQSPANQDYDIPSSESATTEAESSPNPVVCAECNATFPFEGAIMYGLLNMLSKFWC
ncbi:hypothetical protein BU23DRAFT_644160 [Bimuria novae-zelandiae CBS 107.79]|uniref:Uncharacterized protein n=1 Tax=Bimuria novae-zelandiae CBS 107.79 TaxID=1447943 RepID=A0A6A5V8I9_9PLEO|nr:hypothetical protein BU23DRAFT_644160 [Bimuria novae-zelandiae CBS 107.79]